MELVTTTRGARSLIHQGYRYTLNRRTPVLGVDYKNTSFDRRQFNATDCKRAFKKKKKVQKPREQTENY